MARQTAVRLVATTAAALASTPGLARAGWSRPARLSPPVDAALPAPQLAISSGGTVALGSGRGDEDTPASATAALITAAAGRGAVLPAAGGIRAIGGAQAVLALGYAGTHLVVLAGTTPAALRLGCCSAVESLVATAPGRAMGLGTPRRLLGGLGGATDARLVPLGSGGLGGVVGNQNGVWGVGTTALGEPTTPRRLAGVSFVPPSVAATALSRGGSLLAWTATVEPAGRAGSPEAIRYAVGGRGGALAAPRAALTFPAGAGLDGLAVAADGAGATLAWVQTSSSVGSGTGPYGIGPTFSSALETADLGAGPVTPVDLSAPGTLAGDVSLATGPPAAGGPQAIVWSACDLVTLTCAVQASIRRPGAGRAWSPAQSLGAIDATAAPLVTVTSSGTVLVAWIDGGDVWTASAPPGGGFGLAQRLTRTADAADLALAPGPRGQAVAAWTAGTVSQSVAAARYAP